MTSTHLHLDPLGGLADDLFIAALLDARPAHTGTVIAAIGAVTAKPFQVAEAFKFHFDTVQMPVNIMDAHFDSFQRAIIPLALQQKTAVLAMKTFGDTFVLDSHVAQPIDMLHYPMSQPVAVVITSIDKMSVLNQALEAIRTYQPMTEAQQKALLARSAAIGKTGKTEKYKATNHFDSTARNPQYLTET